MPQVPASAVGNGNGSEKKPGATGSPGEQEIVAPKAPPQPFRIPAPSRLPATDSGIRTSDTLGSPIKPDTAIRVLRAAEQSGLPRDLVARNLDTIEAEIQRPNFVPKTFRDRSPVLAKILAEDPHYVPVIRDDERSLHDLSEVFWLANDVRRPSTPSERDANAKMLAGLTMDSLRREVEEQKTGLAERFFSVGAKTMNRSRQILREQLETDPKAVEERVLADVTEYLEAEDRFISSNDEIGMFENAAYKFRNNNYFMLPFAAGVADGVSLYNSYLAAQAMESGTATPDQEMMLARVARLEAAYERRGKSMLGKVSDVLLEGPAFMGEFAATAGLYTVGRKLLIKGTGEALDAYIKRNAKKALGKVLSGARATTAATTGALTQLAGNPQRLVPEIIEEVTPDGGLVARDGHIYYKMNPATSTRSLWVAVPRAVFSQFTEFITERAGAAMVLPKLPAVSTVFDAWKGKAAGRTAEGFRDALKVGGFHGALPEFGEEELGNLMTSIGGLVGLADPREFNLPTLDGGTSFEDALAQIAGFYVMGGGPIPGAIDVAESRLRRAEESQERIKTIIQATKKTKAFADFPEMVAKVTVEATAPGTPGAAADTAYIEAAKFNQYFSQQKTEDGTPVNPEAVALDLVGPQGIDAYRDATQNGGDIAIPMAAFLSKAIGLEGGKHEVFFQDNARIDSSVDTVENATAAVDAVIVEEEKEEEKRAAKKGKRAAARAATDEAQLEEIYREGEKKVAKQVEAQIKQTRFKKEAKVYGTIAGRVFGGLARMAGTTVEDVLRVRPLAVQEGEAAPAAGEGGRRAAQSFEQSAPETPEFRAWFGDSKVVDESGKPLVVYHGTPFGNFDERAKRINEHRRTAKSQYDRELKDLLVSYDLLEDARKRYFDKHGTLYGIEQDEEYSAAKTIYEDQKNRRDSAKDNIPFHPAEEGDQFLYVQSIDRGYLGAGHYFTASKEEAEGYAKFPPRQPGPGESASPHVYAVYLQMRNPYRPGMPINAPNVEARRESALRGVRDIEERQRIESQLLTQSLIESGYDGVISDYGEGVEYVVFSPTQIKSASGNRGTFDPTDPNILHQSGEAPDSPEARGRIALGDGLALIQFLKNADRSTFFHEIGHLYLDTLAVMGSIEGASAEIRAQLAAVLNWLGIENVSQIKEKHHETFARALEAYFMQGKAPSPKLRRIFGRIRQWLLAIYPTMRALGVELNPEITEIFDRMLATEREIQAVKQREGYAALLTDFSGTAEQFRAQHASLAERAEEEVRNRVYRDALHDIARKDEKAWKDEEKKVRAEVAARVDEMPAYKALNFFKRRKTTDEDPRPVYKLARKEVIELLSQARNPEVARALVERLPKYVTGKHTAPVEVIAQWLGFSDPLAFIDFLAEPRVDRDVLIDRMTAEEMASRHGAPLSLEEISERAMEVYHSTPVAELRRMEMEIMLRMHAEQVGLPPTMRLSRFVPQLEVVRRQARAAIANVVVSNLRPETYLASERRALAKARAALKAGNLLEAFDHARRALVNAERYRAAVEAQTAMRKFTRKIRRLSKSDKKLSKTRDIGPIRAARAILSAWGVARFKEQSPEDHMRDIAEYDPLGYQGLKTQVERAMRGSRFGLSLGDATVGKAYEVMRAVNSLMDQSVKDRQIEVEGKQLDIDEAIGLLRMQIEKHKKEKSAKEYAQAQTAWEKIRSSFLGVAAWLKIALHVADTFDLGDPNGPFKRLLTRVVSAATDNYRAAWEVHGQQLADIIHALDGEWGRREILAHEIGYKFSSMRELLHAILHTGNNSNKERLLLAIHPETGKSWGERREDGTLDTTQWDAFLARMVQQGVLDKRHFDAAQAIWDLFEALKPEAQRVFRLHYGHYFDELTAEEFEIPGIGKYRGGYVPAKIDRSKVPDAASRMAAAQRELDGEFDMYTVFPQPSFTKRRAEEYARPLELDVGMLFGHLDQVLRFIHISPATRQTMRIVNHPDFRAAMAQVDEHVIDEVFIPYLKRAGSQRMSMRSSPKLDKVLRFFRRNAAMQFMVANVANALQQLTGLSVAAVKVKPRFLRNAMWEFLRDVNGTAEFVTERSTYMRTAATGQIYDIRREAEDVLLDPNVAQSTQRWIEKHGYILQRGAQNIVNYITWIGAYEQAVEAGHGEEAAVTLADEVVKETQGEYTPEGQSVASSHSELTRLIFMFFGYFNNLANMLASEVLVTARSLGLARGAGRLFYVAVMGYVIPAAISEAIIAALAGGPDDDDDDGYVDEWLGLLVGSQFRQATAMVPVFGSAARTTYHAFSRDPERFYDNRITASPALALLERGLYTGLGGTVRGALLKDEEVSGREVRDFMSLIGLFTGLPAGALGRPVGYLTDVAKENVEPSGPVDFTRGLVTGKR